MDKNKEYFQNKSIELESLLREYKNQYPKNVGALVRNFFPIFIIILSVIAPMLTLFAVVTFSIGFLMMVVIVAPILLIFGIVLYCKNKKEKKADPTIMPRINALKQQIAPYTEYPDVKNYLDKFDSQITETDNAKKKYRKTFRWMLVAFFSVFILLAIVVPIIVIGHDMGRTVNESTNDIIEVLGIDEGKPFLSLTPLHKQVYEGCSITSDTVHFYICDNVGTVLKFQNIAFDNADHLDVFRLIITDKNGVPVAGCGKFVFKTLIGEASLVNSEDFCPEMVLSYSTKEAATNQFKAIETCRYLRDHKEDLSFIVERINL